MIDLTHIDSFTWTRLSLPTPVAPEATQAALQALAGLSGQPRIVLEADGNMGMISWRLGADRAVAPRILAALQVALPGLRTANERSAPATPMLQAAGVHLPGHRQRPVQSDHIDPVARALLGALSQASRNERVRLQLILGPRRRPRRLRDIEPDIRRDALAKYAQYRFGCSLRIAASAATPERTRRLIDGVAAALRGLETPGARLVLRRASTSAVVAARSPYLWPLELSIDELVPMLGWPVASKPDTELPGVASRHPVPLIATSDVPKAGFRLGVSSLDTTRPVAIKPVDLLRHLHLLGPTGVGKSTVMGNLALQVIEAGHGAVVIDPKGDLVTDLLGRIPASRRDDVVVIDPTDPSPVGLAALTPQGHVSADLLADTVLGIIHSLHAKSWGPRTHDILHASLLTLARRGDASLVMVPLLLTNSGFRRSVTQRAVKADPLGLGSFWGWYEGISAAEREHAIAPLMNKLRPILLRPGMRAVLGQRRPRFDLSDVFTKRRIVLVSLSKGTMGPEAAQLLGSLVVGLFWQASLGRAAVPQSQRRPSFVFIDEVQEYLRLPGDLSDALAQARGLGVGFVLAHQHLGQLSTPVREAVMANARSRVAFQLSAKDARDLTTKNGLVAPEDFAALPKFGAYAQLHVDGTQAPWCSLVTQPLPAAIQNVTTIKERSRQRYGQPLDEVERDLESLIDTPRPPSGNPLGRTSRRASLTTDGPASGVRS